MIKKNTSLLLKDIETNDPHNLSRDVTMHNVIVREAKMIRIIR